jgi:hypothetical protein
VEQPLLSRCVAINANRRALSKVHAQAQDQAGKAPEPAGPFGQSPRGVLMLWDLCEWDAQGWPIVASCATTVEKNMQQCVRECGDFVRLLADPCKMKTPREFRRGATAFMARYGKLNSMDASPRLIKDVATAAMQHVSDRGKESSLHEIVAQAARVNELLAVAMRGSSSLASDSSDAPCALPLLTAAYLRFFWTVRTAILGQVAAGVTPVGSSRAFVERFSKHLNG